MTDENTEQVQKMLREIGLPAGKSIFTDSYDEYLFAFLDRPELHYTLDSCLGVFTECKGDEYGGFAKYEFRSEDEGALTIVTLGGSTTQPYLVRNKCWSQYLSEILVRENVPHKLYCGGAFSYGVTQELLKLMRDGMWLKPDIVLSYSGYNNACRVGLGEKQWFILKYVEDLFEDISVSNSTMLGGIHGLNHGIHPDVNAFDYWLFYEQMMAAICNNFHIYFKCFLQPMAPSKNGYCFSDAAHLAAEHIFWNKKEKRWQYLEYGKRDELIDRIVTDIQLFREKGAGVKDEWYVDFSGIFDGIDDIYIDSCHVYERGNRIIAEKVYNEIKEYIAKAGKR